MSGDGAHGSSGTATSSASRWCAPAKRNALSREHLTQLLAAVTEAGASDAAGHRAGRRGAGVQRRARLRRRRRAAAAGGAQPAGAVHRAHADGPGRAAGRARPGARAGHRRGLPAGRLLRPRGRGGVGRVRRAGRQGRLVLPHADGRDRPQRRPQAGDGAGAHRRRHRRRDGAGLGPGQPRRARTTSSTRRSTTSWAGRRAARGPARPGASRRCTPSSTGPNGTPTRRRSRSWPRPASSPGPARAWRRSSRSATRSGRD